jgi:hypothetical protein
VCIVGLYCWIVVTMLGLYFVACHIEKERSKCFKERKQASSIRYVYRLGFEPK